MRGAAVLVGAGLSKDAQRPGDDTPEPPLWWELLEGMIERLYAHDRNAAPSDPLRVAEEFRTYFGQAGLDDFIRTRFPDRAWSPGVLHAELLDLPWTDILTTNWDTLLERASENTVDYSYEIVRTEADLTYARSPRIVKLHGSIGDRGPLIFAEEDYRTYPAKYAAFVNLARQVFIENELCLIGFSGNDPNFLHWAGWVRDHLGGSARRIYIVGNLRLERATRRYLETHNIEPIDLAPLVHHLAKDQHTAAISIFLREMRRARPAPPNEWKRTPTTAFPLHMAEPDIHRRLVNDHALAAEMLEKTAACLKFDRENYRGWLVCPVRHRRSLDNWGANWFLRRPALDLIKPKLRAEAIFEILWCRTTAFLPLGAPLIEAMTEMIGAWPRDADRSLRLEFALSLMRHARVSNDDEGLERWRALIEAEAEADAPIHQEAQYQLCLHARDRMDLERVTAALARLSSEDPIWKLRRAALHTEVGEHVKATKLIKDSAADLERRHRLDRNSLTIKSCLAWANWISRAAAIGISGSHADVPRPRDYRELNIDPLGEIEYFEDAAREIERKRRKEDVEIEPTFDAGHYFKRSKTEHNGTGSDGLVLLYEFDQLIESVGLPIRINGVNVCAEAAAATLEAAERQTVEWYVWLLRVLHSHFDHAFKLHFGRVAIARLEAAVSAALISSIEGAVSFWTARFKDTHGADLKEDRRHAVDMLRLLLVSLSRLTVRMPEEDAVRIFNLAIGLAKDSQISHAWLLEALGELAKYAAEAISVGRQRELALDVFEFPLASEKGVHDRFWPQIVSSIWNSTPKRDPGDARWDSRIRQLIGAAEKGQTARQEAILRLVYLAVRGLLKPDESAAFGRALWSDLDGLANALPVNTGILLSTLAELPSGEGIDAHARLRARLFEPDLRQVMRLPVPVDPRRITDNQQHLISLAQTKYVGLALPDDVAVRMFDEIVEWEPQALNRRDPFATSIIENFNDIVRTNAGDVLTRVVVPSMFSEDRTEQRAQALLAFIRRARSWPSLGALPYFVGSPGVETIDVVSAIRLGLVGSEFLHVASAAMAISCWAKLVRQETLQELPRPLIEQLVATIEARQDAGLHVMLSVARSLLEEGLLPTEDFDRLMKALDKIRVEFRYDNVNFDGARAVSVSLVRAECVKLAVALKDHIADNGALQAWTDEAKSDPLPEVRFSLAKP